MGEMLQKGGHDIKKKDPQTEREMLSSSARTQMQERNIYQLPAVGESVYLQLADT